MKVDRAIEVLKHGGTQAEHVTATRLGIEALELNKVMRETYAHPELLVLPSEEEGEREQH